MHVEFALSAPSVFPYPGCAGCAFSLLLLTDAGRDDAIDFSCLGHVGIFSLKLSLSAVFTS